MPQPTGRSLPLSLPRRFICDLLHFSQQVPTVPIERRMHLSPVVAARKAAHLRPGWCTIFLKAYAILAARRPVLRQMYMPFPRPHLYEHPENVASIAINRQLGEDEGVFVAQFRKPETMTLAQIESKLQEHKDRPIEDIGCFRRELRISSFPRPIRRLVWWYALNVSGPYHARYMGTFGLSVVASLGASCLTLQSPLAFTLNYGIFEPDGALDVRITFDHRVVDGAAMARVLVDLEDVLKSEIVNELGYMQALEAA
jgi:hypothetical protein